MDLVDLVNTPLFKKNRWGSPVERRPSPADIYILLDRKSQKSTQKRIKKSNRAKKKYSKNNAAQKVLQRINSFKKELQKVKSNGHLTQKEIKQVLKKVLNKVRSLKKVLKKVNLLIKGFIKDNFSQKSEFNEKINIIFPFFLFKKWSEGWSFPCLFCCTQVTRVGTIWSCIIGPLEN